MFTYWNLKDLVYKGSRFDLLVDDTTCVIHVSMYGKTFILGESFIDMVFQKVNRVFPGYTLANTRVFVYSGDLIFEWRLGFLRSLLESDYSLVYDGYVRL